MKRLVLWAMVVMLPMLAVGTTQHILQDAAILTVSSAVSSPLPTSLVAPEATHTHDEPIHMPDLRGRTLDYALGIWDDDDGPQIVVERPGAGPHDVVVRQQPAGGTLIDPAHTRIELTLGAALAGWPEPSPTPQPQLNAATLAVSQTTLLRAPYVQNLTTSTLTIVWTTAEDGASYVQYGTSSLNQSVPATTTYITTPSDSPYDRYYVHEATLIGLMPNTVYRYQIVTNGTNMTPGSVATARAGRSSTASRFRFAAFGDSGLLSQGQRDLATRMTQVQPDLIVHTGDLVYPEATYDDLERKFFQPYADLMRSIWIAPSMGNHDVTYNNGKSFTDVFVNPANASNALEKELYYSFDYGNAHFVIVNNYFGMATVGSPQYLWLQNDLAASKQFWKFVVFHEPPYWTDRYQIAKSDAQIAQNLAPLFEEYGVDIVLNGHKHLYERMVPLRGGQISRVEDGGVVYVITGAGGGKLDPVGDGALHPRTAAKVSIEHLVLIEVAGCRLQLSAVQKVSGSGDLFDSSDIFDTMLMDRCAGAPTTTPLVRATATPTRTPAQTPTPSVTPTATMFATPTPISSATPTAAVIATPTRSPGPGLERGSEQIYVPLLSR